MTGVWRLAIACAATVAVIALGLLAARPERKAAASVPAVGPRGPVGPAVPLEAAQQQRLATRRSVEGHTAADIQAACERASRDGVRVVLLPAGQYVFETTVRVPGGLTLLGEGAGTILRARDKTTHLFAVAGDEVRFTRLRLERADTNRNEDNDTHGIVVGEQKNVRIDHCELLGFSFATRFSGEGSAQVDHCSIHHNLRDGLGYGVAVYSGAYVLVTDNRFSQNRHSLASNGALDWSSGERLGKYTHIAGARKTHWEFVHNRVGSNDLSTYEPCAVDTHPGMDGTFVVESNIFENPRHGVGIRDGSGIIRGNVFRNLRTATDFRSTVAISISYDKHNGIPVEGAMPHDIEVTENTFVGPFESGLAPASGEHKVSAKYQVGEAENITIDGKLLPETRQDRGAPPPVPRLHEMPEDGTLR